MQTSHLKRSYRFIFLILLLVNWLPLQGQKAEVKSLRSIYQRVDQSRIKLQVEGKKANLLVDLSNLALDKQLDKASFLDFVARNKVVALQPSAFKRVESETEIKLIAKKPLPDQFDIGEVTYYKTVVDLGTINGKSLSTEVYITASNNNELDKGISLNFNWSALKLNKKCDKPVCQGWVMKDGKAVCTRIKCD